MVKLIRNTCLNKHITELLLSSEIGYHTENEKNRKLFQNETKI